MIKSVSKHMRDINFDKDKPPPSPVQHDIVWFDGVDILDDTAVAVGTGAAASADSWRRRIYPGA